MIPWLCRDNLYGIFRHKHQDIMSAFKLSILEYFSWDRPDIFAATKSICSQMSHVRFESTHIKLGVMITIVNVLLALGHSQISIELLWVSLLWLSVPSAVMVRLISSYHTTKLWWNFSPLICEKSFRMTTRDFRIGWNTHTHLENWKGGKRIRFHLELWSEHRRRESASNVPSSKKLYSTLYITMGGLTLSFDVFSVLDWANFLTMCS